jgi:ferredoxin-NADP reductase
MMFQLEPGFNRAYSIAAYSECECTLIIKRMEEGKGSPRICDANIGDTFQVMIPLGHFILKNTSVPKCFIGTGTGFAPLYAQIYATAQGKITNSVSFIF